jgi:hypothetical protein
MRVAKYKGYGRGVTRTTFESLDEFIRVGELETRDIYRTGSGFDRFGTDPANIPGWIRRRDCPPQVRLIEKYQGIFAPVLQDMALGIGVASSVIGTPCIPAVLAGHPVNCIGLEDVESLAPPRRLWLETVAQARVSGKAMALRAAAVVSLFDILSKLGPVEVRAVAAMGDGRGGAYVPVVPLPTKPLDLSLAALMSHPGFVRGAVYGWACDTSRFRGDWAFSEPVDIEQAKVMLGDMWQEGDVYIKSAHRGEGDEIESDPVGWVRKYAKLAGVEV